MTEAVKGFGARAVPESLVDALIEAANKVADGAEVGTVVADPSGAYIAVRDWNYSKGPYQVSPIGRKWNLVRIGRAEFIPSDEQIDAWPVIFVPSQQATLEDAAQHAFARIASRAITPDVNTTDN
ncbi:hypothetical protein A3O04_05585 [Mycobacteroides abscessus]|nr:hypothetical protein A3O04_05585 [Mycobacteroides abscessus]